MLQPTTKPRHLETNQGTLLRPHRHPSTHLLLFLLSLHHRTFNAPSKTLKDCPYSLGSPQGNCRTVLSSQCSCSARANPWIRGSLLFHRPLQSSHIHLTPMI